MRGDADIIGRDAVGRDGSPSGNGEEEACREKVLRRSHRAREKKEERYLMGTHLHQGLMTPTGFEPVLRP